MKGNYFKILITVLVLLVLFVVVLFYIQNSNQEPTTHDSEKAESQDDEIIVSTPLPGDAVESPLHISGKAKGTWFFEASFPIEIRSDGEIIKEGSIETEEDWMTEELVSFSGQIDFSARPGTELLLVLKKANPSGLPEKDKSVSIPIVAAGVAAHEPNITSFDIYFSREGSDCEQVYATRRSVPFTKAVAHASLRKLLDGPREDEIQDGLITSIPDGVRLNDVYIQERVAYADFSEELNSTAGSCLVTSIRKQITETLLQFETIKDVVISVNGETEEVLQP